MAYDKVKYEFKNKKIKPEESSSYFYRRFHFGLGYEGLKDLCGLLMFIKDDLGISFMEIENNGTLSIEDNVCNIKTIESDGVRIQNFNNTYAMSIQLITPAGDVLTINNDNYKCFSRVALYVVYIVTETIARSYRNMYFK